MGASWAIRCKDTVITTLAVSPGKFMVLVVYEKKDRRVTSFVALVDNENKVQ